MPQFDSRKSLCKFHAFFSGVVICPLIILDLKPLAEKDGGTNFDEFYQELQMFLPNAIKGHRQIYII